MPRQQVSANQFAPRDGCSSMRGGGRIAVDHCLVTVEHHEHPSSTDSRHAIARQHTLLCASKPSETFKSSLTAAAELMSPSRVQHQVYVRIKVDWLASSLAVGASSAASVLIHAISDPNLQPAMSTSRPRETECDRVDSARPARHKDRKPQNVCPPRVASPLIS